MPYRLQANCVQVQRSSGWETLKCHPTRARAVAHLRALEVNVSDEHKNMGEYKLDQSEVNYTALSTTDSQACANCRWFMADMGKCHLVKCEPEPILATGWCDRWELREVEIEEPESEEEDSGMVETVELTEEDSIGLMRLVKRIGALFNPQDGGFAVYKGANGQRYWVAKYTNNFKDRDNEFFTDASHEEYVKLTNEGVYPMPELWTYHTRNTRHGVAEVVWKSGAFVFAAGIFDDTPEAVHAFDFYNRNRGKIKLSHGFYYPTTAKKQGVYHKYRTFEISTLPAGAESNPYTDFEEFSHMALSEQVRQWIATVGGESMLKRVETMDKAAVQETDALKGQGVDYKGAEKPMGFAVDEKALTDLQAKTAALETELADMKEAVKTAQETEAAAKQLVALLQPFTTLADSNEATQKALTAILQKQAEIDAKLAEFANLQPPASKAQDGLLQDREKTFLDRIVTESKTQDGGQSFLDRVINQTVITEG